MCCDIFLVSVDLLLQRAHDINQEVREMSQKVLLSSSLHFQTG